MRSVFTDCTGVISTIEAEYSSSVDAVDSRDTGQAFKTKMLLVISDGSSVHGLDERTSSDLHLEDAPFGRSLHTPAC
jgi:hypothetical protein